MTRWIAMIAHERSGTHLIRGCVNSHPDATCPPEPFFHRPPGSREQLEAVLAEYDTGGASVSLIDVKYSQISAPMWSWLQERKVLHLIRKDARRMYFSAQLRNFLFFNPEWVQMYDREHNVPSLPFREDDYHQYMREWRAGVQGHSVHETTRLYYEDLTDNKEIAVLPEWAGRIICALLEIDYQPLIASTRKDAPTDIEGFWL